LLYRKISILTDATNGLMGMHMNNVIHRDVAPRNIYVGKYHQGMIGDIGLARILPSSDGKITTSIEYGLTKETLGPVRYMAPEAIGRGEYSKATDVFMLARAMEELISGRKPFHNINNTVCKDNIYLTLFLI